MEKPLAKEPSTILIIITAVCLFTPALFSAFLTYSLRNYLLLIGCVLAATIFFLYHRNFDLTTLGVGFAWLLFAIAAMVSRYFSGESFSFSQIALPLCAFAVCVAASGVRWVKPVVYCLLVMLCIHLAATLFFLAFPTLYFSTVKQWFFADYANATGYQCGLSTHYSDNGFLMAMGTILSASLTFGAKKDKRKWYLLLTILFALGLVVTQKRAHLLFTIFALVCLFANTGVRGKTLKLLVGIIVVFIAASAASVLIPGVSESFERFFGTFTTFESGNVEETTSGRILLWSAAINGWLSNPLFGNGWGTFYYLWPGGNRSIYAHNELLQILHDTGIIGLTLFLILIISSLVLAYRNVKRIRANVIGGALLSVSYFAFAFEVFMITYSCTTGGLLQEPLIYMMWFFSVAITLAVRNEVASVCKKAAASNQFSPSWRREAV